MTFASGTQFHVYLPWGHKCFNSVLNVKALVGAFNQEKALVGALSMIVQPVVEPMDRFAALVDTITDTTSHHRDHLPLYTE